MIYEDPIIAVYYYEYMCDKKHLVDIVPRSVYLKYDLCSLYETILPGRRIRTVNKSLYQERGS